MFRHGFLRILLHLVIDGGVYAQAVPVEVVLRAVGLLVLVEPAVNRVLAPAQGIRTVVLIVLVIGPLRLGRRHIATKHIPEVRGASGIVILHLIGQLYWNLNYGVPLRSRDVSVLRHLSYHEIAPFQGTVRVEHGIVARRLVDHTHEQGRLLDVQVGRVLSKEGLGRSLDSVCAAAEEDGIQVHVHDFLLGVVAFQLHCRNPFLELGAHHNHLGPSRNPAVHFLSRIEGLCKLLGDGASAALAGVAEQYGLHRHTGEAAHIDAGMPVETGVLRGDGRIHEMLGKFVIAHVGPVLNMESGQHLAVLGYDLGRKLVVRVLQLFE